MNITKTFIKSLISLANGNSIPQSQTNGDFFQRLIDERALLPICHGSRVSYKAVKKDGFRDYIASIDNRLSNLEALLSAIDGEANRADLVDISGDSKTLQKRTCFGFLVNSYSKIRTKLNGRDFEICPQDGSFVYIYDFENFELPTNIIVVGVENFENFRQISKQKYLFGEKEILFASRYPQNGDLVKWLSLIQNQYIHFGDFDLAGINIYLTEYYNKIGNRASFFVPEDIEERIKQGSSERYNNQYSRFYNMNIGDSRVSPIVDLINKYRKGYDQEGYILS